MADENLGLGVEESHEKLRVFLLEQLAKNQPTLSAAQAEKLVDDVLAMIPDSPRAREWFMRGWRDSHQMYVASQN